MTVKKLKMPIGESDFRRLIQGGYYFVDKSLFIQEVLEDSASVILITRPRRFGKTLNLSMLRYFFAKEVMGETIQGLFDGLKIRKEQAIIRQYQEKYPVIFLTLKDLKFNSFEETYRNFCELIATLYGEHRYLMEGDLLAPDEKKRYQTILEGNIPSQLISFSLKQLSAYLHRYYKQQAIILIDEYDTPIQAGYLNGYYKEIVELFRNFLGAGLKDNPHCYKAVLTGILRVSKESLFSGLNNIAVYSVLNPWYGQYFGFTETEVEQLLKQVNLAGQANEIRHWYNGYQIGPHTIYNPWSILNCIRENGELKRYWLNTSDNALVQASLYHSGLIYKEVLEQLLENQSVKSVIDENIIFADIKTSFRRADVILSFLLMTGYLKSVNRVLERGKYYCELAIPNLEIQSLYADLIENWLLEGQTKLTLNEFLGELLNGDIPAFKKSFQFLLENTISVHDLSHEPEAFYHGFMTGLTAHLQSHPDYQLKSNRESGYGRYDYLILSKLPEKPSLLMEFKRVRFLDSENPSAHQIESALEKAAQEALQQIETQAYAAEAKQAASQQIIKIAIAFYGKRFKLIYTS